MADEVRQRFIIHTCDVFLALLHAKSYPAAKTTLISWFAGAGLSSLMILDEF